MFGRLVLMGAALAALAGCGTLTKDSSFEMATKENTARSNNFQDNLLLSQANDLDAVHACYLRAAGYAKVLGSANSVYKIGEPSSAEGCTVMAGMLRTQSNMLIAFSPFLGQALMTRVPAAPEEVLESLVKEGMKFSLMRFGFEKVASVITNGQAAAYQIASQSMAKNPIILQPGVITGTPEGFGVLQQGGASTVNP